MLAVVQVLAERSGSKATSVDECLKAFRGRLQALSGAHNALLIGDWKWASLASLVQTALEPYLGDSDRIHLDIPDLQLKPEAALTLALGFHELATNAAKYGALSSPTGRISLTAHVQSAENGEELRIVWQETGGPAAEDAGSRRLRHDHAETGARVSARGESRTGLAQGGLGLPSHSSSQPRSALVPTEGTT